MGRRTRRRDARPASPPRVSKRPTSPHHARRPRQRPSPARGRRVDGCSRPRTGRVSGQRGDPGKAKCRSSRSLGIAPEPGSLGRRMRSEGSRLKNLQRTECRLYPGVVGTLRGSSYYAPARRRFGGTAATMCFIGHDRSGPVSTHHWARRPGVDHSREEAPCEAWCRQPTSHDE